MRMWLVTSAGLALLAACTSPGRTASDRTVVIVRTDAPSVVTRPAGPAAGPRARLLRATIPSRNAKATLAPVGVEGTVTTWETRDHVSLSFDRGVLVATRGLGFDLMGTNAGPTLAALAGHGAPVYRRQMRYLDGQDHSAYVVVGCSMKTGVGPAAPRGARLRRHTETCKGVRFAFSNIYWTDRKGEVRKAREWVSPQIGYLETER